MCFLDLHIPLGIYFGIRDLPGTAPVSPWLYEVSIPMNIYLQQERDIGMDIRRGDTIHVHASPDQHSGVYPEPKAFGC
jgi:hypothetical protein